MIPMDLVLRPLFSLFPLDRFSISAPPFEQRHAKISEPDWRSGLRKRDGPPTVRPSPATLAVLHRRMSVIVDVACSALHIGGVNAHSGLRLWHGRMMFFNWKIGRRLDGDEVGDGDSSSGIVTCEWLHSPTHGDQYHTLDGHPMSAHHRSA